MKEIIFDDEKILNHLKKLMIENITKAFGLSYMNIREFIPDFDNQIKGFLLSLDFQEIFEDVRKELQKNIAKTIANKIETEFSGDIKKIMGNQTVREDVRFFLRKSMAENLEKYTKG